MVWMVGHLYDALRAGNVPDDKARTAAEEVAKHEGAIGKLGIELGELRSDVRLLKRMISCPNAVVLGVFALQWQILLRFPS